MILRTMKLGVRLAISTSAQPSPCAQKSLNRYLETFGDGEGNVHHFKGGFPFKSCLPCIPGRMRTTILSEALRKAGKSRIE